MVPGAKHPEGHRPEHRAHVRQRDLERLWQVTQFFLFFFWGRSHGSPVGDPVTAVPARVITRLQRLTVVSLTASL